MNRITALSIVALKGVHGRIELDPLVFVHGPNGSGKTAWLRDAILLLALGRHPDLGSGNAATMSLSDGDFLEVRGEVETPEGRRILTRSWKRHWVTRGARKGEAEHKKLPATVEGGRHKLTGGAAEAEIARILGEPIFLSPNELIGLSNDKRKALLLSYVGSDGGWEPERLHDELADLELSPDALRAAQQRVAKQQGGFNAVPWNPAESSLLAWLDRNTELQVDQVKRDRDAAAKARAALAQHVEPEGDPPTSRVLEGLRQASAQAATALQAATDEHAAKIRAAEVALKQATAETTNRKRAAIRGKAIGSELAALKARDEDATIAALEQELAATLQAFRALERDEADKQKQWRTAQSDAEALRPAAVCGQDELNAAVRAQDAAKATLANARADAFKATANATSTIGQLRATIAEIEGATADPNRWGPPRCPRCTQVLAGDLLGTLRKRLRMAESGVTKMEAKTAETLRPLAAALATAEQAATAARVVSVDLDAKLTTAKAREHGATSAQQTAHNELLAMQATLDRLRADLAEARAGTDTAAEILSLEREFRALQPEGEPPDIAALQAILGEAQLARAEALPKAIGTQNDAAEAVETAETQAAAHGEHARLAHVLEVVESLHAETKRVVKALGPRGIQGRVLADCLGPFVGRVNECLDGANLGTFAVRLEDAKGRPVFWLGLWGQDEEGAVWHPIELLSGGERAQVWPALLAGLCLLGDAPWAVVAVDNVEAIDMDRRPAFFARCADLVGRGLASQAIIAGCPDIPWEGEGWTVIHISDFGGA